MRHDIRQGVKQYMNDDIKPNYRLSSPVQRRLSDR